jgi:hypothetical protein
MSCKEKWLPVVDIAEQSAAPETHTLPPLLQERIHSTAPIASTPQQPREIFDVSIINEPPNLWCEEFQPLQKVTRPTVPTAQAAYYLNRRPQTLRSWASLENGPIRPIRVNGRLAWPVLQMRAILAGESNE